jgi:hypothetical protein
MKHTIELDNKTQRFYQGAAAGAKVQTEHAEVKWPDHAVRVQTYWFYVGALAVGEHGCKTSEDFTHFLLGAATRAPRDESDPCDEHGETGCTNPFCVRED